MLARINAVILFTSFVLATKSGEALSQETTRRYTDADVAFMQGMIGHHEQALVMTSLVPARSNRSDVRILAERIDASQRDEMTMMRRWLTTREQQASHPRDDHDHAAMSNEHSRMPGMLSTGEVDVLAAAKGQAFDRLFLASMIRHHEGALTMVKRLLANRGAAQEPEIFRFISDVDADQTAEIKRMRAMQRAAQRKPR